jgi:cystathionine beta-lyase
VVTGLNMIVQALTSPGDGIIVQPPVYFPFFTCVEKNGRRLLHKQLIEKDGKYSIDFEDLEQKMRDGARMLILCNPHNPVGRCWTREELEWIGAKSIEHGVLVVSDEIHCDLVLPPHRHIPFATLSEDIAARTITCIAPSKTFNLAGLFTSSILISDDGLRSKLRLQEEKLHLSPNIFGLTAAEAAYRNGGDWLSSLMEYLRQNDQFARDFLVEHLPEVTVSPLEATYLLWLDFRRWNLPAGEVKKKLIETAGLGLVDGREFGPGGEGFQRMNIGTPRALLNQALERLFSLRKSLQGI